MATPTIQQEIAGTSTTVTSLTNTATFSSAALAGNQLVYLIAGDKNTGTLSVTDNTGSGTWTVEVSLPSTSVSLYVARKVAVGGETTITGTTTAAPATGNTGYALELDQAGTGAWGVVAKATNITTEATVSSMSTGTTAAATFEGLAIAAMAVDSATNVTSGSWSNGYTARYDAPTTSGTGGGAGGIHVASAAVAQGATTTSTWTNTTGTADQQSAAVVVFGRAASVSVVGTGASALALSTTTAGQKAATSTGSSVLGLATTRTGSSTRTSTAGSTLGVATTSVASSSRSGTGLSALGITTTGQGVKDTVSLPAGGPLFFNFYVVEADGTYSAALPDYRSASIEPVFGEDGSVTIDYPVDGLNYELLRDGVTDELDLELAVWVGGRSDKSMRVLLTESDADLVAETGIHRFGGAFLNVVMSDMVVLPNPANEKQETVFTSATAGAIMTNLITTAKAAGYLASIGTSTFNGSHDSNGVAWSNVVNTKFSPGRGYHDVLGDLVKFGLCEWEVGPDRELRLYQFGTLGTDRTVGPSPVILRWGEHLVSAPRKTSVRTAGTDVLAAGKEGLYQTAFSESARARRGRRILRYVTANGIEDAGSLTAYAQAQLQVVTAGQLEQSHGLSFGKDDPLPIADYGIGDWIGSDTGDPDVAFVKRRVRQWRFAEDENGEITGSVVVGTLLQDTQAALAARIAAIEGGATVVGTSEATTGGETDTVAPAAPTGLVADSMAYQDIDDGVTYAAVTVGWDAVTQNVDGTACTDLAGYRVQYGQLGLAQVGPEPEWGGPTLFWYEATPAEGVSSTSFSFGNAPAGVDIGIRVSAFDRNGNFGPWSTRLDIHTADDNTPPPSPSAATLAAWFRTLDTTWDGLGSSGEVMPFDFDHAEVWLSQGASFSVPAEASTPTAFDGAVTAPQHVANLYTGGTWNQPDVPLGVGWYAALRAVDRAGNPSPLGAVTGPVFVEQLVSQDLIDDIIDANKLGPNSVENQHVINGAITTAKIVDANIVRAKIADLAVNDAKAENISAGKIVTGTLSAVVTLTGSIKTASSGLRWEGDPLGLRFYNAAGTKTIELRGDVGNMLITGTVQTALSGTRLVMNPGGADPDRLDFFPSGAGTKASISSQTAPADGSAAIIIDGGAGATAGRGRFGAYFSEAFVSYSSSETGFSRTAVSCNNNNINIWTPTGASGEIKVMRTNGSNVASIFASELRITTQSGSGGQCPTVLGIAQNAGIKFDSSYVLAVTTSGTYCSIKAADFQPQSSSLSTKDDIADIRAVLDPLKVIRQARARKFVYTDEKWETPTPTEDNPYPEPVPGEAPTRLGVIAEELPDVLTPEGPGPDGVPVKSVSLVGQVGVLWGAVGQILDQEIVSTSAVAIVPVGTQLAAGATIEVPVTWESEPPSAPTGGFATINSGLAWAGKATAWIKTGSVSATGATVVFKNIGTGQIIVTQSAATAVSAAVVGLGLYSPPYTPPVAA